jgi:hypothetical protein
MRQREVEGARLPDFAHQRRSAIAIARSAPHCLRWMTMEVIGWIPGAVTTAIYAGWIRCVQSRMETRSVTSN